MSESPALEALIESLREEVRALTARLVELEAKVAGGMPAAGQSSAPAIPPAEAPVSEEEMLAISAAVAAYLGVRAHVRQVRLIRSDAWAQVGRFSIQSSHRLH